MPLKNQQHRREYQRRWRAKNSERLQLARRLKYQRNRPRERAQQALYYQRNRQPILARVAAYRETNIEKIRAYRKANASNIKATAKRWQLLNYEKWRAKCRPREKARRVRCLEEYKRCRRRATEELREHVVRNYLKLTKAQKPPKLLLAAYRQLILVRRICKEKKRG